MADISMCMNKSCRLKESCYRYQAIANEFWQSYCDFKADGVDDKPCKAFWYVNPDEVKELQQRKKRIEKSNH